MMTKFGQYFNSNSLPIINNISTIYNQTYGKGIEDILRMGL